MFDTSSEYGTLIVLHRPPPMIETRARCEMLRLLDGVSGSRLEDRDELSWHSCYKKKAKIFQATGNYCLRCWQQETPPDAD